MLWAEDKNMIYVPPGNRVLAKGNAQSRACCRGVVILSKESGISGNLGCTAGAQQTCVAYTGDRVGEVGKDDVCEECLCAVTPACAAVLCIPALPKGPHLFWEDTSGAPCALLSLTRRIECPNASANVPRGCRSHGEFLQPSPCPCPGAGAQQMEQCSCSRGCGG